MAVEARAERKRSFCCLTTACSRRRYAPPLMLGVQRLQALNVSGMDPVRLEQLKGNVDLYPSHGRIVGLSDEWFAFSSKRMALFVQVGERVPSDAGNRHIRRKTD